jgi:predicted nucleic acid-binding protein
LRYWDSSAVIPLLVVEVSSSRMDALLRDDAAIVTWWSTPVECVSALARLERDGSLTLPDMRSALDRLRQASLGWVEVPATADVRAQATRLLRVHPLRAADSLQLAAALVAADFQPSTLPFVTLDGRLAAAAEREGFMLT